MIRIIGIVCLAVVLAGCATTEGTALWRDLLGLKPAVGTYYFDWRLSGDPDPAPLQVFDDGQDTWLHYPEGRVVPALFARTADGDRLLQARRVGDYLAVRGVHGHLLMRGGLLQAEARRNHLSAAVPTKAEALVDALADFAAADAVDPPVPVAPAAPIADIPLYPAGTAKSTIAKMATPVQPMDHKASEKPRPEQPLPPLAGRLAPIASPVAPVAAPLFEVTPADGNVRRALSRWAGVSGWTFEAEHWAVDVDIPLAGSAVFNEPFRTAVRSLLAATELGDRPVQPCFYANQVLRVVPLAQRCDRTQIPGAES